jgi:hypothetical protein
MYTDVLKCIFFEVLETKLFRNISFLLWVLQYFKGVHYRDICLFYFSAGDTETGSPYDPFLRHTTTHAHASQVPLSFEVLQQKFIFLISHSLCYVLYGEAKSINWK